MLPNITMEAFHPFDKRILTVREISVVRKRRLLAEKYVPIVESEMPQDLTIQNCNPSMREAFIQVVTQQIALSERLPHEEIRFVVRNGGGGRPSRIVIDPLMQKWQQHLFSAGFNNSAEALTRTKATAARIKLGLSPLGK